MPEDQITQQQQNQETYKPEEMQLRIGLSRIIISQIRKANKENGATNPVRVSSALRPEKTVVISARRISGMANSGSCSDRGDYYLRVQFADPP
jgi:hypothetical protein